MALEVFTDTMPADQPESQPNQLTAFDAACVAVARSRYSHWQTRDRRAQLVRPRRLGTAGWSLRLVDHSAELLVEAIQKRIDIYRDVALEYKNYAMLAEAPLQDLDTELRQLLELSKSSAHDQVAQLFKEDHRVFPIQAQAILNSLGIHFDLRCLGVIGTGVPMLYQEGVAISHAQNTLTDPALAHTAISTRESRSEGKFIRQGKLWNLSFNADHARFRHRVGFLHLVELLRLPGTPRDAAALAQAAYRSVPAKSTAETQRTLEALALSPLETTDQKAIQEVRADLKQAKLELDKAKNEALIDELKNRIAFMETYLRSCVSANGRPRKTLGSGERARVYVTNNIRRSIETIEAQLPLLGAHLRLSVKTGSAVIYSPMNPPNWEI